MKKKCHFVKFTNGTQTYEERFCSFRQANEVFNYYLAAVATKELFLTRLALGVGDVIEKEFIIRQSLNQRKTLDF